MFLKLNNDKVLIIEQVCADGRKKRNWLSKVDTTSPTVTTESLMLIFMIDAMKGRDISTSGIPGAFLQTDYNKVDMHINLEGVVITLLEDIDLDYYKDFIYRDSHGIKCMYV